MACWACSSPRVWVARRPMQAGRRSTSSCARIATVISSKAGSAPPLGPGSNAADQPDEYLRVTITEGRGRMPSFSSSLSEDQVRRLIDYLREAQAG